MKRKRKKSTFKEKRPKPSKGTKNESIKCSNKLNNNSSEYIPSRHNVLVKENSHKSIYSNWKTNDSLYESTNTHNEVAKDSGWKKSITDSFNESTTKSLESHNKWISLSKQEINHQSWNNTFKTENNISNNWIARGMKIGSSWSVNGKEQIIILMIVMKTQNILHIITDRIIKMIIIPGIITIIMVTNLNVLIIDHINKIDLIQIVKRK